MSRAGRDVAYLERGPGGLANAAALVARVYAEELGADGADAAFREADAAEAAFDEGRDVFVTAEVEGRTVGALLVVPAAGNEAAAEFRWFAVSGDVRGTGIGRELLFRGIEACRQRGRRLLRTYAFAVSPAACRLYWMSGFRVSALEPTPVGTATRERIVFEKTLEAPAL